MRWWRVLPISLIYCRVCRWGIFGVHVIMPEKILSIAIRRYEQKWHPYLIGVYIPTVGARCPERGLPYHKITLCFSKAQKVACAVQQGKLGWTPHCQGKMTRIPEIPLLDARHTRGGLGHQGGVCAEPRGPVYLELVPQLRHHQRHQAGGDGARLQRCSASHRSQLMRSRGWKKAQRARRVMPLRPSTPLRAYT